MPLTDVEACLLDDGNQHSEVEKIENQQSHSPVSLTLAQLHVSFLTDLHVHHVWQKYVYVIGLMRFGKSCHCEFGFVEKL